MIATQEDQAVGDIARINDVQKDEFGQLGRRIEAQVSMKSEDQLSKLVSITAHKISTMNQEQKCEVISKLRRLCYSQYMLHEVWKIPADYDFKLSTADNYRATLPKDELNVGRFADLREQLDLSYHGYYTPERQLYQDVLVEKVISSGSESSNPWIIFTAGPMGAGKSHTLEWMSERGYFPLKEVVQLDPDKFKVALPEWSKYVEHDMKMAGQMTQRESGMLVEIGQMAAMRAQKNIWIDGSFRDGAWYEQVFEDIRSKHPEYRIAILYVHASREIVLERARRRAEETGRYVPDQDIEDSLQRVPQAVNRLAPRADFLANIDNSGELPILTGWSTEDGACLLNVCGSFDEVSKRFLNTSKKRSKDSWLRFLTKIIQGKEVLVFTKSYCTQTQQLNALLTEMDVDFTQVKLDEGCFGGPTMHNVLKEITGCRTTPLLFIGGTFLGGFDDAQRLYDGGKLKQLVANATAIET